MAPRNRIAQDPRLKKAADEAIRRGCTVDQLLEVLNELIPVGAEPISRSGAGRYFKGATESMADYREAQEIRKMWIDEFGKNPDGDIGELLVQLLQTAAYGQLRFFGDQPADLSGKDGVSPRHVALLAGALKDMASAKKIDADRILKIRLETASKAAAEVEKVAKAGGMTADTVAKLRAAVLGTAA